MQSTSASSNPQVALIFNSLLILVLLLCTVSSSHTTTQQLNNQQTTHPPGPRAPANGTNVISVPVVTAPTVAPTTSTAAGELLLLSGAANEFVDYTESPSLLIDNLSETDNSSQSSSSDNRTTQTPSISTLSTNSSPSPSVPSTSSISSLSNLGTTTLAPPVTSAQPLTATPVLAHGDESNATTTTSAGPPRAGGLEEEEEEAATTAADADSDGAPVDEDAASFVSPRNVTEYMDYIERLFHDFRHQITDLFEPHIPQLIRTSQMVQLSGSCSFDMLRLALALRQFEPWALRVIDSSGKIPEGIFEGSFTALGSYDECLTTEFSSGSTSVPNHQSQQQQQQQATRGKYCLVNVTPFLPPKPPADRVERLFQDEANRRNYSKDNQFSRLSPMFYYMKFRIGVCIPSTCLESDMDSISSALSSSLRLNITVPHCRVKQTQPISNQQLVAGSIFGLVVALTVAATMVDLFTRKLNQMSRREQRLLSVAGSSSRRQPPTSSGGGGGGVFIGLEGGNTKPTLSGSRTAFMDTYRKPAEQRFAARLARHWTWLSFSLLTNFKLYFSDKWSRVSSPPSRVSESTPARADSAECSQQTSVIKCLDGIRVISLFWVILANSYVTLDPKATKLLSETRKAPKDFLFQLVVQASLAIETFFFLSGLLMSLSFANRLKPTLDGTTRGQLARALRWVQFYVHRYIRMTPATMLVIAFSMFAFRFGDGPLWLEATQKAHQSCKQNWWRHLLHVANFVDTRQMCFIHYWYIAADMQLFLVGPLLMFLLYHRRRWLGYGALLTVSALSLGSVFYTTYIRNLPPTLLFYNSDPESRREYGNTIMTKPLTHAMPYMVGMLVGKWLLASHSPAASVCPTTATSTSAGAAASSTGWRQQQQVKPASARSLGSLLGLLATLVALAEVFLPYKWNNSHLPSRILGALYAALFRFAWSLVLACLVLSCRHRPDRRCRRALQEKSGSWSVEHEEKPSQSYIETNQHRPAMADPCGTQSSQDTPSQGPLQDTSERRCMCASGGSLLNRFLSLPVFTHLSKLSFVGYLVHLPLMSTFVSQTRSLFAFSHMLVLHLALSYLVMTFILAFVLVHLIEFPFITFERYLFQRLLQRLGGGAESSAQPGQQKVQQVGPQLQPHQEQQQQQQRPANTRPPFLDTRRVDIEDLRRRQRHTGAHNPASQPAASQPELSRQVS